MATVILEPQQGAYGGPGTVTKQYVDEHDEEVRTGAHDDLARVQEALSYKLDAEEYTRAQEDARVAQEASQALTEAITAEASAREGADIALGQRIDTVIAASDVKDIVGTHADLESYDTSTLGDNDIIKVLTDETQSDQTTYYRWIASTSQFNLIGSEGPYYTKSAADQKFQDKLTAGANITIDANNEISATDTTYSDFVGTDGIDPGTSGLVPAPVVGDEDKYLKGDGTWGTVSAGPTVVQTTGTSQTDVMSQVATSQMIYPSGDETNHNRILIGDGSTSGGAGSVSIGRMAQSQGQNSIAISPMGGTQANANNPNGVAIGSNSYAANAAAIAIGGKSGSSNQATAGGENSIAIGTGARVNSSAMIDSVALGSYSKTSRAYEVAIGSGDSSHSATYQNRYLANVKDPSLDQDAATKHYVDGKLPTVLTTADYDYPSGTPNSIAVWNLAAGEYKAGEDILINKGGSSYNKSTLSAGGTLFISKKDTKTCAVVIGKVDSINALRPAVWFYNGSSETGAPQEYTQGAILTTDTLTTSLSNSSNGYPFDSRGAKTLNENKLAVANLHGGSGISVTVTGSGANQVATVGLSSPVPTITLSTTDIGEGASLAANTLYGVYS